MKMADRLSRAVRQDIKQVPIMDKLLSRAKQNYTRNMKEIEFLKNSGLGKVVGEELASDIMALTVNKVSPEKVFKKFDQMDPSDMKVAIGYLDRFQPELSNAYRAAYLADALRAAKINPASGGPGDILNPVTFLQVMGVRGSGKNRMMNMDRVNAIFAGTEMEPLLNDLIQGARVLADTRFANKSGTAITQDTKSWIEKATSLYEMSVGALRKSAGTVGYLAGLKGIADRADPRSARYLTGGDRFQLPTDKLRRVVTPATTTALQFEEEFEE